MRLNGVLSVDDNGIIASLIKHTEFDTHDRRIVHTAAHGALVGGYHHDIVFCKTDIGVLFAKGFQHLIGRADIIKSAERDRI